MFLKQISRANIPPGAKRYDRQNKIGETPGHSFDHFGVAISPYRGKLY